jgi:geranylgeranyl reductase family protein
LDADVIVVGAGPAGSAAAYHLARRGRRVLLLERQRFPRDKSCGDGLTRFAVSRLEAMGVLPELADSHVVCGVRFAMRGRGCRDFDYPTSGRAAGGGLVVPRYRLDTVLARRAAAAGAELCEATRCTGIVRENGSVVGVRVIRARGGRAELRARAVVAADGAPSQLAREAGLAGTPSDRLGIAVRGYYSDVVSLDSRLEIFTPLLDATDRYLLPSYGWVFPLGNGRANVGVGLFERQHGANVRNLFERFVDSLLRQDERFSRARALAPPIGAPLRFDFAPDRCAAPGFLIVGDAAGLISPFTGEGIGYALESGELAAECLDEALRGPPGAPIDTSPYAARLARSYTGYFETGRESAKRYRLIWHVIDGTFDSEQPLFALCRQTVLFPEGLGESFTTSVLDDVRDRVAHAELPLRSDLLAVDELLADNVRREWPFLARALALGQHERGIPFRPALLLLLAREVGDAKAAGERAASLRAAAAIELGFFAALAHFSVGDEAAKSVQHPQPTHWGNMVALLLGDYLLAQAHALTASVAAYVTAAISETLAAACEARVSELRHAIDSGWTSASYVDMTARKSAPFFELPCRVGGLLGVASPSQIDALARYGQGVGVAFALASEAMLVDGSPRKLARYTAFRADERIGGMPLLLALQSGEAAGRTLRSLLHDARCGTSDANARAIEIARIVRDCGAIEATLRLARARSQQAVDELSRLPWHPAIRSLEGLAAYASEHGPGPAEAA